MDVLRECPCPVVYTLNKLNGKWKFYIIWQLARAQTLRFNELRRRVGEISNLKLSQSLSELSRSGIVQREQFNEVPPRVEYSLTELGRGLLPVFDAMYAWGVEAQLQDGVRTQPPETKSEQA